MSDHHRLSPLCRLLCVLAIATPTPAWAAGRSAAQPVAPARAAATREASDVVLFVLTAA
ncbi:MAG: hypothetical protein H7138_04890, partial [Myxococcales bacterium]|nr:hypothetical protein [Myxococcales bacterium]